MKITKEQLNKMIQEELEAYMSENNLSDTMENIEDFEDFISDMFNMSIPEDVEEGERFTDVWSKEEYTDEDAYDEESVEQFNSLINFLKSVGGKATLEGNPDIDLKLLSNGDIEFSAIVTLEESLNESVIVDRFKKLANIRG